MMIETLGVFSEREGFELGVFALPFPIFSIMVAPITSSSAKTFSPVTALWIIAIPLMDMLAIVIRRSRNGKAPFEPDRNHLHHLFMDRGMSDRKALLVIGGALSIFFATIGIVSEIYEFSQLFMLIAFLAIFFGYYQLMSQFENQRAV